MSRTGSTPGAGPAVDSQQSTHGNQQRDVYQLWTVNSQHMEINKGKCTSCGQSTVNTCGQSNSQHMEINKRTCTSCGQSTVNTWKSTKGSVPAVDSQQSTHGNQQRACTSCGQSTVNTWKSTKGVYQLWTVNSQHMEINKGRVPAVDSQQSTHGNQQRACTSCGQSTVNTWKSTKGVYQLWTVNSQHMEINN